MCVLPAVIFNSFAFETEMEHSALALDEVEPKFENDSNKLRPEDRPVHGWYQFVLSFPPHLVRNYIDRFGINSGKLVLDPFCGTGTTLVECKKRRIGSIGIEANPVAFSASQVKTDWKVNPDGLLAHASAIAGIASARLESQGLGDYASLPIFRKGYPNSLDFLRLPAESSKLLLKNSISPLPLHKTLVLLNVLREHQRAEFISHERLALAKALVTGISNLHFGPEVGVGPPKSDVPVISAWLKSVQVMADDLRELQGKQVGTSAVYNGDSRHLSARLSVSSVDAVITSPPYPNEKDYTRTTRLESVLLGLIQTKDDLRRTKHMLIKSNTRCVYKNDRDDQMVAQHARIQAIAERIEARRIELGKTSGFERLYGRVTKLYFGGMAMHLADLRTILRPGAMLAYVVGDQASYLRVMIRTGQILAEIAQSLGYELVGIDLFRTRLATATREQLREEVVVLRWPKKSYR